MLGEKPKSSKTEPVPAVSGIGRSLDDNVWLYNFEEILGHLAKTNNFTFDLRKLPSIIHASASEVRSSGQLKGHESSDDLIEKIISQKLVDENLALNGLALFAQSISLKSLSNKPGRHDISLRIKRFPYKNSFESYIEYERSRVRTLINPHQPPIANPTTPPAGLLDLYLGTVVSSKGTKPINQKVKIELGEYVRDSRLNFGGLTSIPVTRNRKVS